MPSENEKPSDTPTDRGTTVDECLLKMRADLECICCWMAAVTEPQGAQRALEADIAIQQLALRLRLSMNLDYPMALARKFQS